jgi:hypothetical protein
VAERCSRGWVLMSMASLVAFAACSDSGGGPRTNQLVSSPTAALAVRVSPIQPQLAQTALASCPMTQPFATHFDLVLGPAAEEFFLDTVALRFGAGISPFVFTKNDLSRQFGTLRVPSGTSRAFTLQPEFGCGFSTTPRSLLVDVTMVDGRGQRQQGSATASFGS